MFGAKLRCNECNQYTDRCKCHPLDAAPVAARELDVEAEFQKWWNEPRPETGHAPSDFMDVFSARAAYFAARSAAQGKAPAPAKELAHGHREDFYLMANARRIGLMPIRRVEGMTNWILAHELFATGSNSAHQICVDSGIDPAGYTVEHAPSPNSPVGGKD